MEFDNLDVSNSEPINDIMIHSCSHENIGIINILQEVNLEEFVDNLRDWD